MDADQYHISSEDDDYIDRQGNFVDGYSLSADVSESESCSSTTTLSHYGGGVAVQVDSASPSSSNQLGDDFDFPARLRAISPVFGGKIDGIHPEKLVEKHGKDELSVAKLMKERFAKLLLGEDMSGGAKGVSTALAISNAITNLAACVFGKLWKLEPLIPEKKSMWLQEMDWLLYVSNFIIEFTPSKQDFSGGGTFEVMVAQTRRDLSVHLPALKKIDRMLLSILDEFHDSEFCYVDRRAIVANGEYGVAKNYPPSPGQSSVRIEEKWWLPIPKVPLNGLSKETRKRSQHCRECLNQIYKAAAAINNTVLAEMEIPKDYLDGLDKNVKACLSEILHRYITADEFFTDRLLHYLDISSEHTALEIANRIEAALHIWKQKLENRKTGRSPWSGAVKGLLHLERTKIFADRAETLLRSLKSQFPNLPQTALDTIKIQHNKDVGQSILESYSRVIESLTFNLMARIDELLHVDNATRQRATEESASIISRRGSINDLALQKQVSPRPISIQLNSCGPLLTRSAFCSAASVVRKSKKNSASLKEALDQKATRLNF